MMLTSYGLILAAVAFEVLGQICLKRGAISPAMSGRDQPVDHLVAVARSGWTYAGAAAYAAELFLWIAALHLVPLSRAFPVMSLSYCGVAIASRLFLKERISARSAAGIVLITLGTICIVGATA